MSERARGKLNYFIAILVIYNSTIVKTSQSTNRKLTLKKKILLKANSEMNPVLH